MVDNNLSTYKCKHLSKQNLVTMMYKTKLMLTYRIYKVFCQQDQHQKVVPKDNK